MKSIIRLSDRKRGDTFPGVELQYLGDNNVPINLTGSSIKIDFKRDVTSNSAEFTFSTSDSSILIHEPLNGKFKLVPRLLNYQIGKYFFDIQLTSVDGVVKTIVDGEFNIVNDITK
jgi:hypothetical protein